MDTSQLEQLFSNQWKRSVSSCYDSLERDDMRQVTFFNTWDDVQKQIIRAEEDDLQQSAVQEFSMLMPGLNELKVFMDFFSRRLASKLDTSAIWGLIGLITTLVHDEESSIHRIPRMLRELCHKIEILNNYCSGTPTLIPQIREACFEVGTTLLSFFSYIVQFLRSDIEYLTPGDALDNEWQPLSNRFNTTTREIEESLSRVERLAKFAKRSDRADDHVRTQPMISVPRESSQPEELAKLPCVMLPSIRTSRFFDRIDMIGKMEEFFSKPEDDDSFRSLALYGLGGVGKSSVALRYAETKLRRGELDAMFWVHSEKLVNIRQSFTDIAMRLKLPDATQKDHDENHARVLDWLQHTQCRWLIVFDNAESIDLLRAHWPAANRGQALITSRNHSFAFEPADGGLEIKTWDAETGSKFLLHLLSTDISTELTADEDKSARELSKKLSGHALAISHMAGLIHRRAWSIAEFVNIYNQHPSEMHGVSGNTSINALWDFAFKSLDESSRAILGVLCFLAPDNVPQSLFELEGVDLPESLSFCSDNLRFFDAIETLLTLALIKRDKASRTFSVHRLVQTSFKYFMAPEQKLQSFNDATTLVYHAFPKRDSNVAQLYLVWEQCALYLQHVLCLKDCFLEERKLNAIFTVLSSYCDLNNRCQRYLLEINAYTDLEELIQANTLAMSTLPQEEQTISLQGSLTSHTGQLFVRLGKTSEGVEWLKKSYEIRRQDIPFNHRESAWAAGNAAEGYATINDFAEAITWQEVARDHWLEWSNKQNVDRGTWPATLKKNLGIFLVWAGESARAQDILSQAIQQIESTSPYNWAMAASAHFAMGNLDRHKRKFESAEAHFMEAQNSWVKGDQLRTDPFNAACMYKMGCTALDMGKLEAAIKHLRDSMVITEMRQANLVAEHARCVFKLSEALEQEPRDEQEAIRLRDEAELLLHRRDPETQLPAVESTFNALVHILWR